MPSINDTLSNRRPLLLMSDYDGTLTPIVDHFEQAQIRAERIEQLRHLAHLPGVQLAIVSGRSLDTLRRFLAPLVGEPIYLVGLHGGEVFDLAQQHYIKEPPFRYRQGVERLKAYLYQRNINRLPGIELEDKGYSLGVHYRFAGENATREALDTLREGLEHQGLAVEFILRPGKKLLEAVPKGFNKGVGVEELRILARARFGIAAFPVYFGDDVTDFDAFKVVHQHKGLAVYVGDSLPQEAPPVDTVLPDVEAVYDLLRQTLP